MNLLNQRSTGVAMLLLIASMGTMAACESTTTGKSGELKFKDSTDDDFANFNKPIAVGAKLDLRVYDAGSSNVVANVDSATSEDEAVLKIGQISGNTVTIEATGDGSAELSFVTSAGEDSIDMMARVPEVLKVRHLCLAATEVEGYYLQNQDVYLPFDMELKDGQSVIGYGYYPVKFDNEAVTLDSAKSAQSFLRVKVGAADGKVVMSSDIDDTTLTLNLVKEGAINGAKLDTTGGVGVNKTAFRTIQPTIDSKPICQAQAEFTVEVTSPDICDVTKVQDESTQVGLTKKYGWIEVKGKVVGDCAFTVTYPKGAEGAGASEMLTLPIEQQSQK